MIYNLIRKLSTDDCETAKSYILKSKKLNEKRVKKNYKKAFPYKYNPNKNFVFIGDLNEPFIITDDFKVQFLSDKELIDKNFLNLDIGQILVEDSIVTIPPPSDFYSWINNQWVFEENKFKLSLTEELAYYRSQFQKKFIYLDNIQEWSDYHQMKMIELRRDFETNNIFNIYGEDSIEWFFNEISFDSFITLTSAQDIDNLLKTGKIHESNCRKAQINTINEINSLSSEELLNFNSIERFHFHYNLLIK